MTAGGRLRPTPPGAPSHTPRAPVSGCGSHSQAPRAAAGGAPPRSPRPAPRPGPAPRARRRRRPPASASSRPFPRVGFLFFLFFFFIVSSCLLGFAFLLFQPPSFSVSASSLILTG